MVEKAFLALGRAKAFKQTDAQYRDFPRSWRRLGIIKLMPSHEQLKIFLLNLNSHGDFRQKPHECHVVENTPLVPAGRRVVEPLGPVIQQLASSTVGGPAAKLFQDQMTIHEQLLTTPCHALAPLSSPWQGLTSLAQAGQLEWGATRLT